MIQVSLNQMKYILAVWHMRNFSMAAKTCHVSQPSLSNQIQKFEEENRVILFDRSIKPIGVTDLGREIVSEIERVFAAVENIENLIDTSCHGYRGTFRLGMIPTLGPYLTPLFIQAFSDDFPELNIQVEEMKTQTIFRHLEEGLLDAGLVAAPRKEVRKYGQINLFHEPFYLLTSPDHPLAAMQCVEERELDPDQIWLMAEGHCLREQVISLCGMSRKDANPNRKIQFTSTSIETLVNMTHCNSGFTLIPYLAAMNLPGDLRTARVRPLASPCPSRKIALVFKKSYPKKGLLEGLAKAVKVSIPETLLFNRGDAARIIDIDDVHLGIKGPEQE